MAACGTSLSLCAAVNFSGNRSLVLSEKIARISGSTVSFSSPLLSVSGISSSAYRVAAKKGFESLSTSDDSRAARLHSVVAGVASPRSQDLEVFQARGWSDVAWDEAVLLQDQDLADLRAREAFSSGGDITEDNMERLVEALVSENGQSTEDYNVRAILFGKIAEFFNERRSYSPESSASAAKTSRSVQILVDQILADDGRSPMDYNLRAQVFAKSAATFPFLAPH